MKKINTTIIFSFVWTVFLIIFLIMGCISYQSANTELPRYYYEAPTNAKWLMDNINLPSVMEGIAKTHNTAVEKLEKSIRSEAKTMTAINFVSAFLCFLGLFAQIRDHLQKKLKTSNHQPITPADASPLS